MFNILAVDDDEMICELVSDFLSQKGYGIQTANSGEEALKIISEKKPDLVFLDLAMPGMGGEETLKEIKKYHQDLTVIIVSVMTDEHKARRLLNEGASDYIVKPINFNYMEKNLLVWQTLRN